MFVNHYELIEDLESYKDSLPAEKMLKIYTDENV